MYYNTLVTGAASSIYATGGLQTLETPLQSSDGVVITPDVLAEIIAPLPEG